jgi:asparagine synthase (glutamine-hydrolysing)
MCGIAGFLLREGQAQQSVVQRMCDVIRHRGPDDEGFHVEGGCAIGMRRLSIIDLHSGHQPISNEDGSVWVVFNGEIYNYQPLRAELIAKGHRFHTNSDTETLIHLYEEEGVEGLSRLRGMFAYCIWDSRKRKILLVRDRFGKKPLYYALTRQGLFFGSELKCLRVAGVPLELDEEALRLYFHFSYIPDPYSPFQAIRKLPPGSWMSFDTGGRMEQGRYWTLPAPAEEPTPGMTFDQACEQVRTVFDESVKMRMIADVPLGAFLSGGIDSSSVVASMALQSPEPVKTFSIGFEESAFNELQYASMIARQYKTDHHEILVRPDSVSLVSRLAQHFDEPFGDTASIPTFIVSEFAARHVKVALSGDGGDELFGGYESFFDIEKMRRFDLIPGAVRKFIGAVSDLLPYSTYGKNYLRMFTRPTPIERYFESNYGPYSLRKELFQPEWMPVADSAFLMRTFKDCLLPPSSDVLAQAMYFEATAKLTGDMLVKVDRMSMANSLEVRSPMLDHVLAELAATIPQQWKVHRGMGKYILVKALGDRLPHDLIYRKKMGFGFPLVSWFRSELRDFLQDHLLSKQFLERGLVSPVFLRKLLDEHQSGRRDNSGPLWRLLMAELWFRDWEQAEAPSQDLMVQAL